MTHPYTPKPINAVILLLKCGLGKSINPIAYWHNYTDYQMGCNDLITIMFFVCLLVFKPLYLTVLWKLNCFFFNQNLKSFETCSCCHTK